ncbi:MAG: N-acetylneuraminate synthase family protein [Treponema sp.]|jgi:sialic acid synthase SpsE|nr:N-acetylneuraminate synthase family protein [Treponema sp.]
MKNTKTRTFLAGDTTFNHCNPLIIAELGTAHGGCLSRAKEMARAAADAGAGCVKLQMVFADEILHPNTGEVMLPGGKIRLYDRFKQLEMPPEFYAEAKNYIESLGLLFLCTPFGLKSAEMLRKLQPKIVKIASPELNFTALLQKIAGWGLPVLLSSGVSTLGDIEEAVRTLGGTGDWGLGTGDFGLENRASSLKQHSDPKNDPQSPAPSPCSPAPSPQPPVPSPQSPICLLHCVTAYPAPETDYNLRVLRNLSAVLGVSAGLSDHSLDPELVPALAVSQGAAVVEKHFCLSRDDPGLDDPIALPPSDFACMVKAIRHAAKMGPEETVAKFSRERGAETVEAVLGSGIKKLAPSEKENYSRSNRSIHALRDIQAGETISAGDFAVLRTEKILRPGLAPSWAAGICGRTARQFIPSGEGVRFEDI